MIEIKDLCHSFGSNEVLKNINLTVNDGEIMAVMGSSGGGKPAEPSSLLASMFKKILKMPEERWEWFFKALLYSTISL
jgi:ABC-type transporter Mla maintaining outer membrane lipid asymmetry ATPase subunit MlaF